MLRIVKWVAWQGRAVREIERKRLETRRRVVLSWISVTSDWDDRFLDFVERLGAASVRAQRGGRAGLARNADGFLLRILQYVARHGAESGRIHVERERFGAVVLSTRYDLVSRADGSRVYDALLASGLAVEDRPKPFDGGNGKGPGSAPPSAPYSAEPSAPDVGAGSGFGSGEDSSPLPLTLPSSQAEAGGGDGGEDGVESPTGKEADGEASSPSPLVLPLRERLQARPGGVSAERWEDEARALLADGVTAEALLLALDRAPLSAKPWEAWKGLREEAARRKKAEREAERAQAERRRVLLEECRTISTWTTERQARWLEAQEPRRRARYLEGLEEVAPGRAEP